MYGINIMDEREKSKADQMLYKGSKYIDIVYALGDIFWVYMKAGWGLV
jgi:hypothetical protein